jgi:uncharacterized protein YbaR (Trm112 family)
MNMFRNSTSSGASVSANPVSRRSASPRNCWPLYSSASKAVCDQESKVDSKLLDILACPACKGPLIWNRERRELVCRADRLAFPVRDDIPVMLEDEARTLTADDPLLAD